MELARQDNGESLEAQLTRQEAHHLALRPGERVFLELRNLQTVPAPPEAGDWSI